MQHVTYILNQMNNIMSIRLQNGASLSCTKHVNSILCITIHLPLVPQQAN